MIERGDRWKGGTVEEMKGMKKEGGTELHERRGRSAKGSARCGCGCGWHLPRYAVGENGEDLGLFQYLEMAASPLQLLFVVSLVEK